MHFGWSNEALERAARYRALGAEVARLPERDRLEALARGGALGVALPREAGGEGASLVETALAYESLGAALPDAGALLAAGAHLFGVALPVARVGTAAQRARWLPALASGEALATVAATERDAGSDIAKIAATATVTERGYVLRGTKRYVTMAARAARVLTFARLERGGVGAKPSRGLVALLVDARAAGVRVGDDAPLAGAASARVAPVVFDDVEVPSGDALGTPGAGLAVFQISMAFERALVLAFRLGALERALAEGVAFARERRVGGVPIASHQAVSHRLANMKLRLEASHLLVYRAAWELDQGRGPRAQLAATLAKWHVAEAAASSALDAIALRGGEGVLTTSGLPGALGDALAGLVHSGTSDVLASIVAGLL